MKKREMRPQCRDIFSSHMTVSCHPSRSGGRGQKGVQHEEKKANTSGRESSPCFLLWLVSSYGLQYDLKWTRAIASTAARHTQTGEFFVAFATLNSGFPGDIRYIRRERHSSDDTKL